MTATPKPIDTLVSEMKAAQQALSAWNQYGGNITHAQLMGQAQNCAISLDRMLAQVSTLSTRLAESEAQEGALREALSTLVGEVEAAKEVFMTSTKTPTQAAYLMNAHLFKGLVESDARAALTLKGRS
jgi:hypothetical protein